MGNKNIIIQVSEESIAFIKKHNIAIDDLNAKVKYYFNSNNKRAATNFKLIKKIDIKLYLVKINKIYRAICSCDYDLIHEEQILSVFSVCKHDDIQKQLKQMEYRIMRDN